MSNRNPCMGDNGCPPNPNPLATKLAACAIQAALAARTCFVQTFTQCMSATPPPPPPPPDEGDEYSPGDRVRCQ